MGYGYQNTYRPYNSEKPNYNRVLKELKESFEAKLDLYFPKMRRTKLSRIEKQQLKERLNFEPKMNPVLGMFKKINEKLVLPLLS